MRSKAVNGIVASYYVSDEIIPSLINAMENNLMFNRSECATALGKVGSQPNVIEGLTRALRNDDVFLQMAAVESLGQIGTKAKAALPELLRFWAMHWPIDDKRTIAYAIKRITN